MTGARPRVDRVAAAFGVLLCVILLACLAAPLWADGVAGTGYETNHLTETITVDGEEREVVDELGRPIGPTWRGQFFLGADANGRDIMVRLLYGGRNSIAVGLGAALGTILLGLALGLLAGYFRGRADAVISGALDLIWAFPVILLGIALGTALALGGLEIGPLKLAGDSLAIPILIIAVAYVPYLARPVRGRTMALREREFVAAAEVAGMGPARIVLREILPNVLPTLFVFAPLLVANAILLEAGLSFLGAGIQPPNPSWGSMISEGVERISSAPQLALAPGLMLVLTVLSLNVIGERLRSSLDPRSEVRIEH